MSERPRERRCSARTCSQKAPKKPLQVFQHESTTWICALSGVVFDALASPTFVSPSGASS